MKEEKITLEEALKLARDMEIPAVRTGRIPTTGAIDRYILLEGKLERAKAGSVAERRLLNQLSSLEAVDGVTTSDVMQRREELRK